MCRQCHSPESGLTETLVLNILHDEIEDELDFLAVRFEDSDAVEEVLPIEAEDVCFGGFEVKL